MQASWADTGHLWTFIQCSSPGPTMFSLKTTYKVLNVYNNHSLPVQWHRLTSLKPLLQTHRIPASVLIQPCWQQDPSNPVHSTEKQRATTSHEIPLPREIIFSLFLCQVFDCATFDLMWPCECLVAVFSRHASRKSQIETPNGRIAVKLKPSSDPLLN